MIEFSLVFKFVLAFLTSYRLSELVALDDGPMYIFKSLREFLGKKASEDRENKLKRSAADLVHCPFCVGVWFSAFTVVLVLTETVVGNIFLLIFGIAGAQSFLSTMSKRFID